MFDFLAVYKRYDLSPSIFNIFSLLHLNYTVVLLSQDKINFESSKIEATKIGFFAPNIYVDFNTTVNASSIPLLLLR